MLRGMDCLCARKMEGTCSSKTMLTTYKIIQCHEFDLEDHSINLHYQELTPGGVCMYMNMVNLRDSSAFCTFINIKHKFKMESVCVVY
jgi:hypothetical protein